MSTGTSNIAANNSNNEPVTTKMVNENENDNVADDLDQIALNSKYKPPPEKSLQDLIRSDQQDESLQKYKEKLLGEAITNNVIVDVNDPRKVIVKKLVLLVANRPDMTLDLTEELSQFKKKVFTIKEGVSYKIRIDFLVQREIVHGLKYVQKIFRMGIPVEKISQMVGSYPPKVDIQSYTTPAEEAPSGMLSRGTYTVSSLFTDDDKNEHLKWEWSLEISKDWKD